MDLWRIAVRGLAAYAYLLVMMRASGKRVVSQVTPFDLLVSLIIGDLIDNVLWAEVPFLKFGVAAATIVLCDLVVKIVAHRSEAFHRLVNGQPTVMLRDGVEDRDALRSEQMNEGDVAHLLRLEGIDDWNDVHIARMEIDHEISVVLRTDAQPAQRKDVIGVR